MSAFHHLPPLPILKAVGQQSFVEGRKANRFPAADSNPLPHPPYTASPVRMVRPGQNPFEPHVESKCLRRRPPIPSASLSVPAHFPWRRAGFRSAFPSASLRTPENALSLSFCLSAGKPGR